MYTTAVISVLLLTAVVFALMSRTDSPRYYIALLTFVILRMVYELTMMITAYNNIRNVHIANIDNLVLCWCSVWLVYELWKHISGSSQLVTVVFWATQLMIFILWLVENQLPGIPLGSTKLFTHYNTYVPAGVSFILILVTIYLINQLMYLKSNNIFLDADGLLLIGLLLRFIPSCLIMVFFKLELGYSKDYYINILFLANLVDLLSTVFFLMAVLWLPQKKKYTWPF